jgi:hypothetical protein
MRRQFWEQCELRISGRVKQLTCFVIRRID